MPRDVRRPPSWSGLNESPPEKEGKSGSPCTLALPTQASMKALPKRKGNLATVPAARMFAALPQ